MPFSKRQLDALHAPDLISASRVKHLATRTCEVWLKRATFRVEDATVKRLYALYSDFYRDVRSVASDEAERLRIDTLQPDASGNLWRKAVISRVEAGIPRLTDAVAAEALRGTTLAYYGGYYGRLWLLEVATTADIHIAPKPPPADAVYRQVLQPLLREDEYDSLIRSMLGQEWRDLYANELDGLTVDIRRALNTGMSSGEGIPQLMRRVRKVIGVETDRRMGYRQNFAKIQTLTRTFTNKAGADGAVEAYKANADVLSGWEWLAAGEGACPICEALDGTIHDLNDSNKPPAHPSCRCTPIPVIRDDILTPDAEPPHQTMGEWAAQAGLDALLGAFLGRAIVR